MAQPNVVCGLFCVLLPYSNINIFVHTYLSILIATVIRQLAVSHAHAWPTICIVYIYIYKYIYIQVYIIHCIYSHKENIKFNERTRQKRQRAFDVVGNAVGPNRSEEPLEVASTLTGHRDRAARKIELTIDVLAMGWLRCGSVLFGFEMLRANSPKSASLDQRKVYGLAFHRE